MRPASRSHGVRRSDGQRSRMSAEARKGEKKPPGPREAGGLDLGQGGNDGQGEGMFERDHVGRTAVAQDVFCTHATACCQVL